MAKSRYVKGQEPWEPVPKDSPMKGPKLRLEHFDADTPGGIGRSNARWSDADRKRAADFLVNNSEYLTDLLADICVKWVDTRLSHDFAMDELVAFLEANGWRIPTGRDGVL